MDHSKLKGLKIDQIVAVYRKLRDNRDAAKKKFVEEQKPTLELMEAIEGELLSRMHESGSDSFKCETGTAFKVISTSVTVQDWSAFFEYVMAHKAYDLLVHGAAKTAVADFAEEHEQLPPGVSMSRTTEVQIRAPKGG